MRVLIYASECNPDFSSEPAFIYHTCRSIVDMVDEAVVVTHIRNKEAIDAKGMGKAQVVYLDTEYIARPIMRISYSLKLGPASGTAIQYPVQYAFEYALWKRFKLELQAGAFDVVHRVGPISPALPSPLASWSSVPFVIGPINGGLPYPPQFSDVLRKEGEWLRYVRQGYRLLPYATSTFRNAAAILAAFEHTIEKLPPGHEDRIIDVPEIGASPDQLSWKERPARKDRIDFMFVGRLVPFKCVDVVISAFAASNELRKHRLLIVGDGPERPRLEQLVRDNGLADCVICCGWVPQAEVAQLMQDSDVFAFPSIRDSGAGVIAEAMMAGLAPIVVDYGPGRHLVTDKSGIRIPLGSRKDHIRDFQEAMERLATDASLRLSLGKGARDRAVNRLSWPVKAQKIVDIYDWVIGSRPDKPGGLLWD
ncbi:MAG: glycosyltransferase family 4 protein [Paracoccaceae bacterium]